MEHPTRSPRGHRWPRQEYWAPRRLPIRDVRRRLEELDPASQDVEVAHLALEVLTPPRIAVFAYAIGAARTNASPRIAERQVREGRGDQIAHPRERIADTLTFFGELMRCGHRSAEGRAVCDRINGIHREVGRIRNEDQIFVLSQLAFGPEIIGRAMGRQPFSHHVLDGLFHFWLGVGRAMKLKDLPETRPELAAWALDYERRCFEPSADGQMGAEGYRRGLETWFPRPARRLVRRVFVAAMDEPMRECLGYQAVSPAAVAAWRLLWRATLATTPGRLVRLDSTWTNAFSRVGPDPDLRSIGFGTTNTRT